MQPALELSIIRRKQADDGRSDALAKSQWSFRTATELSAAIAAKKVSAVELAQDLILRIERHDGKINAICVRDFARGLEAAHAADAALARPGMTAEQIHASKTMTLRTVLPAFIAAKPSLISDSFSRAEIQSSRCSLPRM